MYNEALKEKYISSVAGTDSTAAGLTALFDSVSHFEEAWDADLCTRTAEELIPLAESIVGLRAYTKWARFNQLKSYVKWCINMGVEGACDGMLHVEVTGFEKIRKYMFKNPDHVKRNLDAVFPPENEVTIDDVYRAFIWLIYLGGEEEDVLKIKTSDVNFKKRTVKCGDSAIKLGNYEYAWDCVEKVAENDMLLYRKDHYNKLVSRAPGDNLLRGFRSSEWQPIGMRGAISKPIRAAVKNGLIDVNPSVQRIALSGEWYRMWLIEQDGRDPQFMNYAIKKTKNFNFDPKRGSVESQQRIYAAEARSDYNKWKAAFNL